MCEDTTSISLLLLLFSPVRLRPWNYRHLAPTQFQALPDLLLPSLANEACTAASPALERKPASTGSISGSVCILTLLCLMPQMMEAEKG